MHGSGVILTGVEFAQEPLRSGASSSVLYITLSKLASDRALIDTRGAGCHAKWTRHQIKTWHAQLLHLQG